MHHAVAEVGALAGVLTLKFPKLGVPFRGTLELLALVGSPDAIGLSAASAAGLATHVGILFGYLFGESYITPIMENQMEKNVENDMETGVTV